MGAIRYSVRAAFRTGTGLIKIATSVPLVPFYNVLVPEAVTCGFPDDSGHISCHAIDTLLESIMDMDVLLVGPGFGVSSNNRSLLLGLLNQVKIPVVLDADGINNLKPVDLSIIKVPVVITPHQQEFARFLSLDISTVKEAGVMLAQQLADECGVVVVLKGHQSLITNGQKSYKNTTGNPGMATAGAGDVLAGIISALLGMGQSSILSAMAGVFLHGLAGDLAREKKGEYGLIASDIVECIPEAIIKIQGDDV